MRRRDFVSGAAGLALGPRLTGDPEWSSWRVDGERVNRWLTELSRFGANPEGGVSRIGFSDADVQARGWLQDVIKSLGMAPRIDPVGNILVEIPGSEPGLKPLLFGSHIDSVPKGGNYDGDVGSLSAVEVAATLRGRGYRNRHPLWVTIWCDEENGLTGSRGFIGHVDQEELRRPSPRDGVPLADKIRKIGGDPEALGSYRHESGSIAGYVELHIEQGGTLDRAGIDIGVVLGIVGIRSFDVTVTGFANHAGTTPMPERKNALVAASELVLLVDRVVKGRPGRQVGTVGRLEVKPGAQNVIPGDVNLSIELRDLEMGTLEALWREIEAGGDRIMAERGTTWEARPRPTNVAAMSDPVVRSVIAAAAKSLGLSTKELPSGAGHDAQDLAKIGPMGMIFVPSVGGISHSPKEFTKPADVTNGANVLLQTILRLDRG